jgi:hypothetical protein
MSDIEDIKQKYAQKCAQLGDLVVQQRRLHTAAEHVIREIEQLEQDARALTQEQPTNTTEPTNNTPVAGTQEP